MDLITTLLVYMGLTVASGVQAATPPAETPVPTPPPESVVEVAPAQETAPVIGSYLATIPPETPVPEPTITPNRAYTILRLKSKGSEVRRLQERLKELGYLSGSVDGVYGYQTRNAVISFQRHNGLTPDGDAGPSTQTILFESPGVVPNPDAMTPSPEPTATPGPDGLIPIPEDYMASWRRMDGAQVLLNGEKLSVDTSSGGVTMSSNPRVWLRGAEVMISVNDLAEAIGDWEMNNADTVWLDLRASGYAVIVIAQREPGANGFCDSYTATVDGAPIVIAQGDMVSDGANWYCSEGFLKQAMHAEMLWEGDEMVLVMAIPDKATVGGQD